MRKQYHLITTERGFDAWDDLAQGGTIYSGFINISDMEFVLAYKLDSEKITRLDLNNIFQESKNKKIKLH